MRVPLDISYQGMSRSEAVDELIRSDAAKLEKVCDNLISCRVGLGLDQKSSTSGNEYRLRIEMRVPPGHNLVVTNTPGGKEDNSDLPALIKSTFKTAHRRLRQQMEKQQGEKKHHPGQEVGGFVTKIFADEGYGFLRSLDGEEVYFHRNSIVGARFENLEPGAGVNYTAELGEKGLQASTVQVIQSSPGRAGEEGQGEDDVSPLGWQRQKK